ncbi:MAG: hypothetical protein MMC23_002041 [Stictis urceolatum]|nr:hypothetical protein [Stictis urceolata]
MPYTALLYASRKPGTSPAQFREHWENKHLPLVKSLSGPDFPLSHTRYYLQRSEDPIGSGGPANRNTPAAVLAGLQEDFDHDGFAILTFEDEAAFQRFYGKVSEATAAAKIAADEENFLDRTKLMIVLIGETTTTRRD